MNETCLHLFSQNSMFSLSFAEIKVSLVDATGGSFHQQVAKVFSTPTSLMAKIKASSRLNAAVDVIPRHILTTDIAIPSEHTTQTCINPGF